jgi:hypothetical protein
MNNSHRAIIVIGDEDPAEEAERYDEASSSHALSPTRVTAG